ncbi:programmed cell death 1 ligand 1 [Protobothrops mucrosquamatus]|uniref:programmed cell death 1 ligand 1 n=1 Tax=Protobothrops mucrosquamatus TaxID=103944 RepID=UPI0010FB8D04|nr:programmed cell death 1 ligand 1 [Protobothrops mucrosquamatus]
MAKFLPVLLFATQLSLTAALFRVSVIQPHYSAEYGSNVTIGCRFPTDNSLNLTQLNIFWQLKLSDEAKEVYKLQNGREDLSGQHRHFQGRATLLYEELKRGYSMLHITHLKITDAGRYLCVVNYREADYKYIDLKIEAPYKRIKIQERKEEEEHILICQSEGYPMADVLWLYENRINDTIFANTSYKLTDTGLFNVTSVLRIRPSAPGNYSCIFQNKELRQTSASRTVFLIGKKINALIMWEFNPCRTGKARIPTIKMAKNKIKIDKRELACNIEETCG